MYLTELDKSQSLCTIDSNSIQTQACAVPSLTSLSFGKTVFSSWPNQCRPHAISIRCCCPLTFTKVVVIVLLGGLAVWWFRTSRARQEWRQLPISGRESVLHRVTRRHCITPMLNIRLRVWEYGIGVIRLRCVCYEYYIELLFQGFAAILSHSAANCIWRIVWWNVDFQIYMKVTWEIGSAWC